MMVIDTVHSSGVGRMHGRTKWMTTVRPLHSFQGSEAKRSIVSTSAVENKGSSTINLDSNLDTRPTLVIRRRIMVSQLEEAAESSQFMIFQTPFALSNQPNSPTTAGLNPSSENKTDLTVRCFDDAVLGRSSASTQDHVCKSTTTPMLKPRPKMMHLFDLNKLPTSPDSFSLVASPTSTIASADSTTFVTTGAASTPAMATDMTLFSASPYIIKTFTDAEGDAHRGGAKLAVDLGLLPPPSLDRTRRHNVEDPSSTLQETQYCADIPTSARKRLRKLSEYAGGAMSSTAHAAPMASKSWTTDGDDVCNHRDVTKTLALPEGGTKVRSKVVVDDEVLGAVSVLLMMASSKKRRRESSYISSVARDRSTSLGEEEDLKPGPSSPIGSDLADSETTSSGSLGSGSSVLLRPSNKQRYRSMAELMTQTPILRRG